MDSSSATDSCRIRTEVSATGCGSASEKTSAINLFPVLLRLLALHPYAILWFFNVVLNDVNSVNVCLKAAQLYTVCFMSVDFTELCSS